MYKIYIIEDPHPVKEKRKYNSSFALMTLNNYKLEEKEILECDEDILITFSEENRAKMAKPITAILDKETGCWNCTSHSKEYNRYPRFERNSKTQSVHRYIYTNTYGDPGEDLVICHTCDNPKCINPLHLVAGTQLENMQQMKERGRAARGERHWNSKLTDNDVIAILFDDVSTHREIAQRYGVTEENISQIKSGKLWKHINRDEIEQITADAV